MKKIAITMGDPAGIGPEIIIKALRSFDRGGEDLKNLRYLDKLEMTSEVTSVMSTRAKKSQDDGIIVIGSKSVFKDAMKSFASAQDVYNELTLAHSEKAFLNNIEFIDIPCNVSQIKKGYLSKEAGRVAYECLKIACELVKEDKVYSIATAPVSKEAINMAGYNYSGQTEILETMLGDKNNKAEMLFVSDEMRTLLLTRHLELASTSRFLTKDRIIEGVLALNKSLTNDFNILKPRIAICAFNPHAGENGILGQEEIRVIIPAVNELKEEYGVNIEGPFPADTLWAKAGKAYLTQNKQPYDAYVACYHDQGLIPVKLLAMDKTVNTTINLPVIRTSPAHGTAFDIADKYCANPDSMVEAIRLAQSSKLSIQRQSFCNN